MLRLRKLQAHASTPMQSVAGRGAASASGPHSQRMPVMQRLVYALIVLAIGPATLVLCSCGPKGPVRYEVTGTVTYNGEKLDEGIIDFWPQEGQASKSGA